MTKYIPIEEVRRLFEKAGLPIKTVDQLLQTKRKQTERRNEERRRSETAARRGLRLRTTPTRWDPSVRMFHPGDVRTAIIELKQARNRSTANSHREKGVTWLPALLVESEYGFDRATLLAWHARRKKRCPWFGNKKLTANLWLAHDPADEVRLKWVWFYAEQEIKEAKANKDRGERTHWQAKKTPKAKKKYTRPNMKLWADTDEAMEITGATTFQDLYNWHHKKFLAPGGIRLPLKKETYNLPKDEGGRKVVWWREHLKAIGVERKKLRPDDGLERLAPHVDEKGDIWQRERLVKQKLGCNDSTLDLWAERCPALGGKPFERVEVTSRHSSVPDEWVYRDKLYQELLDLSRRTKEEWDAQDFILDERGAKYLPLRGAREIVPPEVLWTDAGPEPGKPIHTRIEKLPYRPERKSGIKQKVYHEEHLRRRARELAGRPAEPGDDGSGHVAKVSPPAQEPAAAATTGRSRKMGAPAISGEERQKRLDLMRAYLTRPKGVSRAVFREQEGYEADEFQSIYIWFKTQPERQAIEGGQPPNGREKKS